MSGWSGWSEDVGAVADKLTPYETAVHSQPSAYAPVMGGGPFAVCRSGRADEAGSGQGDVNGASDAMTNQSPIRTRGPDIRAFEISL
jgi:hypothetical protein